MIIKTRHNDGSETTIKTDCSRSYTGGSLEIVSNDRNKYSIIISSSVGCQMGCKMCGIEPGTFKALSSDNIIDNVKEAVRAFPEDLSSKYVKLCFMGMGEASLESTNTWRVPAKLVRWLTNKGYAIGLDSIDYGTILPDSRDKSFESELVALNIFMKNQYPINPANDHGSIVRLFFSCHGVMEETRGSLIPGGDKTDLTPLFNLTMSGIDVIFHYTLIDGVNDSEEEMDCLKYLMENIPIQLRMLRYNTNGRYRESQRFVECWDYLSDLPNIKFQISPGKDQRAACGMFY